MEKEYNRSIYCLQDDQSMGTVQISDDVIARIACLAATEVKGVAAIAGNLTSELLSKAGRKNLSKGAKIAVYGRNVKISLAIMMEFGYNIPGTCTRVQDRVKSAVENMTGLNVSDVDIRIASVDMKKR
ncbi:MAG: Asp23/Gls24 family envelope stress response protein [Lachnospiraceae bacterium]